MKRIFQIFTLTILLFAVQNYFGQNDEKTIYCHSVYLSHGIKFQPKPEYPKAAKMVGASGKVSVQVVFDEEGNVTEANAVSGHPLLYASSVKVAKETKFYPVTLSGKAVRCRLMLDYNFVDETKKQQEIPIIYDLKPKAISMPKPEFPNGGKNVSGTVSVIVTIDEEGSVINAEAVSGHPLLRPFAEKAAMKAKFEPVKLSGKPVKIRFPIAYEFKREESQELVIKKTPKLPIVNGMARVLPKPDYPQEAKDLCVGGKVEIEVLIDSERGDVLLAKAISGDELLRSVSVEASKKAKFNPLLDMTPIKLKGIIVYNFPVEKNCLNAGIVNKKAIKIPIPQLPHSKITKETEVKVLVVIDENGNVISARLQTNVHPLLRVAFEKAAREAKFNPTLDVGKIKIKGFIVYKIKPNRTIDTDIERDDKSVIGTPINLVKPPKPFCNCRFGGQNPSVLVEAKTDEQGNVVEAKAISGHPILKNLSEKAALESKFLPTYIKAKILIQYNFEATDESARDVRIKDIEIKEVKL
ncbi:MAG TPA: energy transducer TonB [Pyrinomonadaceae bacterium]|nr:energy transducer TonB [Pyrinomonadaceae bacterium]